MKERNGGNKARKEVLLQLFAAGLSAVDPMRLVPPALPVRPPGRTVVVGAGKASAAMARATEEAWKGPLEGLVLTRYDHSIPCKRIEVVEAAHPVPDAAGREASARVLALARGLGAGDLLLTLISGGGSALLVVPAAGIELAQKREISRALLRAGARIGEINAVRKHISAVKGGRLAAAAFPAAVHTLAISDVPGDDPATIASGPTVADPTSLRDARDVIERYRIDLPPNVAARLDNPCNETPMPGDARLVRSEFVNLAGAADCLAAAATKAEELGYGVRILGEAIEGPALALADSMAESARRAKSSGQRLALLSGGESTVEVRGSGKGGPNAEFALAFAIATGGMPGVSAISADTDGIDGTGGHAGAIALPDTLASAAARGLDPKEALARNDAAGFFDLLGDTVETGPTRTNVSDFRAIIVEPS